MNDKRNDPETAVQEFLDQVKELCLIELCQWLTKIFGGKKE